MEALVGGILASCPRTLGRRQKAVPKAPLATPIMLMLNTTNLDCRSARPIKCVGGGPQGREQGFNSEQVVNQQERSRFSGGRGRSLTYLAIILLRAGDVESNPGSACGVCSTTIRDKPVAFECVECHGLTHIVHRVEEGG